MTEVVINGEKYIYITDYKESKEARDSFNELTRNTYDFDFETWYQAGYWGSGYIPCSLLKDNKIVANASINVIDFSVLGEHKRYIQIGTVMTDEKSRNMGLSRFLMELILKEWENNCDLIYLFANDSVLDFYPKFGFVPVSEYEWTKPVTFKETGIAVQKLDMSKTDNQKLLYDMANNSKSFSKISMLHNAGLVLFYCTSFKSDLVFYIPDYNAIVVAEFNKDSCYIQDIFCTGEIPLDDIIDVVINENVRNVTFGFTPQCTSSYRSRLLMPEDETLFVKPDTGDLFKNNQLRFPVLSHA